MTKHQTSAPARATSVTPEQVQALLDKVLQTKADQEASVAATASSHEAETKVAEAQAAVAGAQALANQRKTEEALADGKVNTDLVEVQAMVNALVQPAPPPEPTP